MELKLQQNNILLRTFKSSEIKILYDLIDRNREHLGRWLDWVDKTKTIKDTQKFFQYESAKYKRGEGIYLGIWFETKLAGVISFHYINKTHKSAAVGYWLGKEYEGKGIMLAACKLLVDYGFKKLKLHRIDITHAEGNKRSENLIKKLGFVHEGHLRKSSIVNGEFTDHEYYGILADEWIG